MKITKKIAAIIKNQDGKVLIFQEFSKKKKGFFYNIAKGTVEDSDLNFNDALEREIFEETNLQNLNIGKIFDVIPKIEKNNMSLLLLFEVTGGKDIGIISNINNTNESIKNYTWVSKNDFLKIPKNQFIDKRIHTSLKKFFSS